MFNHFVFDIDGTLIDTEKTGVLSLIDTVRDLMGKEMSYEEAYGYFGIPSIRVGPMMGYEGDADFGEEWENNFIRLSYLMKPFLGAKEVLEAIHKAGKTIGCVTSRNRFEFNKDPHLKELIPYFDHTICSEDSIGHKPDPDPMFAYMKKASAKAGHTVTPDECVYIGDTMHDCQCAKGAGCRFALADWNGRGLQGIPADWHFTKPEEILSLLKP